MLPDKKNTKNPDTDHINSQERNKLLWSLRSDFAWVGKKIPESIEIDGEKYKLGDFVRELEKKELIDMNKVAEVKALILKLKAKAETDEQLLATEDLTTTDAEALYEEATGLLRTVIELKDKLDGKGGQRSVDEFKRMLNAQRLVDEKNFQQLLKSLK